MSAEDDIFNSIINGPESAGSEDIKLIDTLAYEIIADSPTTTIKSFYYGNTLNDTAIEIGTEFPEELDIDNTFTYLKITDNNQTQAVISFNPRNELSNFYYPTDATPSEIRDLLKAFLESNEEISINTKVIIKHVDKLFASLEEYDAEKSLPRPVTINTGGKQIHVADLMRQTVNETIGNVAIQEKEFSSSVDNNTSVHLYTHTPLNISEEELLDFAIPVLQIIVTDHSAGVTHIYNKTIDGERSYDISKNDEDNYSMLEPETDEDVYDDIVAEFANSLMQKNISSESARMFIDILMEAQYKKMEQYNSYQYPDLQLGFIEDNFSDETGMSATAVTKEVLRALHLATQHRETELPQQPPYHYSENKRKRLSKFMNTKIPNTTYEEPVSRNDLHDKHLACEQVLDELASHNHPVAQAIAKLGTQYRDMIDDVLLQYVTTEIIQQTHQPKLRELLNKKVATSRISHIATKNSVH
jgi:hypothetical protein